MSSGRSWMLLWRTSFSNLDHTSPVNRAALAPGRYQFQGGCMFRLGRVAASLAVGFLVVATAGQARAQCAAEPHGAKLLTEAASTAEAAVPRWLVEPVIRAAQVTGVDPAYMLALADKESSFDPQARAKTSSAVGLFQF